MENNFESYIVSIPVKMLDECSASELRVFARIQSLTNKRGYCWATNSYLGERCDLARGTISNIISSLSKKGWLITFDKIEKDKFGNHITKRIIQLPIANFNYIKENVPPSTDSMDTPSTDIVDTPSTDSMELITNNNNNIKESKEKVFSNYPEDVRFNRLLTKHSLNDKLNNLEKILSLEEFDKRNYPEKFKDYKNAELWYNLVIKANHLKEPPVEWMNSKVSTVAKAVLEFMQNQQVMKVIQKIQNGHIQNIEVLPHNFISKFNRYE